MLLGALCAPSNITCCASFFLLKISKRQDPLSVVNFNLDSQKIPYDNDDFDEHQLK